MKKIKPLQYKTGYIRKEVNTRGIECTLRYNFNTTKSNYKGKGAGNTEKKRL